MLKPDLFHAACMGVGVGHMFMILLSPDHEALGSPFKDAPGFTDS